jgi:hypothetical protein
MKYINLKKSFCNRCDGNGCWLAILYQLFPETLQEVKKAAITCPFDPEKALTRREKLNQKVLASKKPRTSSLQISQRSPA